MARAAQKLPQREHLMDNVAFEFLPVISHRTPLGARFDGSGRVKSPAEGAGGWFDPFSHEKPERALSLVSLLVIAETHQPGTVPVIAPAPPAPCKDFMNLKEAAAYFGVLLVHSRIDCEGLHRCQTMDPHGFLGF